MRDYEPYYTQDGSIGLYSYEDNDVYHSKFGALSEAWEKFVLPAHIDLSEIKDLKILDICYGIGYNTKAVMSFCINEQKIKLKKYKQLKFKNNKKYFVLLLKYIVTRDTNKIINILKRLLTYNEMIYNNNIKIDCLDINDKLVKISPFFKNMILPSKIIIRFLKKILHIKNINKNLTDLLLQFDLLVLPKNNSNIIDLLNLKFKENYFYNEYKIDKSVNYILINKLKKQFGENYLSDEYKKYLTKSKHKHYFNKALLKYAKKTKFYRYKTNKKGLLSTFLHNIYYEYLSFRYNIGKFYLKDEIFDINFYINDARKTVKTLNDKYDLIFLDAFTYSKAPQLWSLDFFAELYDKISDDGLIITYSNSILVRNTLLLNKFYVGKIYDNKKKKFIGTIASKNKEKIFYPLSEEEIGLCNTKAGIPYRDLNLTSTAEEILKRREFDFHNSNLISSSRYLKQRGNNEK